MRKLRPRGTTLLGRDSLESMLVLVLICVPCRALGLPEVMPVAGWSPVRGCTGPGQGQAQTSRASLVRAGAHLWGQTLPEFSKPSPTPDQPQGPGPAGSYKAWAGCGDPETEESLSPFPRAPWAALGVCSQGWGHKDRDKHRGHRRTHTELWAHVSCSHTCSHVCACVLSSRVWEHICVHVHMGPTRIDPGSASPPEFVRSLQGTQLTSCLC